MSEALETPLDEASLQAKLDKGCDQWSKKHKDRYKHIGTLPKSRLFKDQQIEVASRKTNRAAIFLPEAAYVKAFRLVYAKSVGSKALAATIVETFNNTLASAERHEGPSITGQTIAFLENNYDKDPDSAMSMAVISAHLDRLTDIADFIGGLSLAVAEERGKEFRDSSAL